MHAQNIKLKKERLRGWTYDHARRVADMLCDPTTDKHHREVIALGYSELSIVTGIPQATPAATPKAWKAVYNSYLAMVRVWLAEGRDAGEITDENKWFHYTFDTLKNPHHRFAVIARTKHAIGSYLHFFCWLDWYPEEKGTQKTADELHVRESNVRSALEFRLDREKYGAVALAEAQAKRATELAALVAEVAARDVDEFIEPRHTGVVSITLHPRFQQK